MVVCERTTSHRQLADLRNFKLSNFCYLGTRYEIGDRHRRSKHGLESGRFLFGPPIQSPLSLGGKATGTKLHLHHKCPFVAFARVTRARPAVTEAIFFTTPLATWMRSCGGRTHISSTRVKGFSLQPRELIVLTNMVVVEVCLYNTSQWLSTSSLWPSTSGLWL